ncbi:30S ribosomal protein S4, partial [Candidatus Peregrinibacteria bacterium]|nr:30S ribosomal protein S4 [Candidatus Peregrinibacteria bacterium]
MSRYRGAVVRQSRRLGLMLFGNGESKTKAFNKKKYKPGEHGQKRFSQISEYGKQLQEKQKARFMYGISEKQCRNYYKKASKNAGVTGEEFMKMLERRLDNVIYRAGFAASRPQARQMVSHSLIKINGRRVKTPSIQIKEGDKFEVIDKKKDSKLFEVVKQSKTKTPKWISADVKGLKGEVTALPDKDDIERAIDN